MSAFVVREACPEDVPDLLRLVRALAEYEREPDAVEATEESLTRALFCAQPLVHAEVAEAGGRVIGIAVWFLTFSTWTGRHSLYLEDIFVEPDERARGVGRALVRRLAGRAAERGCARMDWSVLDWNEPAMAFYRSLGARPMDEWTTWRLDGVELARLAQQPREGAGQELL